MPASRRTTISMRDAITDKLRMKDGRTREMDQIFKAQDKEFEAMSLTIKSDRRELRRSDNIVSSDELKSEKQQGTVGLKGAGQYNPATASSADVSSTQPLSPLSVLACL